MDDSSERVSLLLWPVERVGAAVMWLISSGLEMLEHIGGGVVLLLEAMRWIARAFLRRRERLGVSAIVTQIVRVGVRSIFIVSLVSTAVGIIMAIQMAPSLEEFGVKDRVANIVGIAVFRELGPLIGAIVLTGFAGASIAAEIGTMQVAEEIEALRAHALNPVRFLVVPRVTAAIISMTCLGVMASAVANIGGYVVSITVLEIPSDQYLNNLGLALQFQDFATGFIKGGVFGALIGVIACHNGLKVSGGAAGVGAATTDTVVQCVVSIIFADLVFTALFFAFGWV